MLGRDASARYDCPLANRCTLNRHVLLARLRKVHLGVHQEVATLEICGMLSCFSLPKCGFDESRVVSS